MMTSPDIPTPKQLIFKRFDADYMMFIFGSLCSDGKSNRDFGALGPVILNSRHHNHCKEKTAKETPH